MRIMFGITAAQRPTRPHKTQPKHTTASCMLCATHKLVCRRRPAATRPTARTVTAELQSAPLASARKHAPWAAGQVTGSSWQPQTRLRLEMCVRCGADHSWSLQWALMTHNERPSEAGAGSRGPQERLWHVSPCQRQQWETNLSAETHRAALTAARAWHAGGLSVLGIASARRSCTARCRLPQPAHL